MIIIPSWNTAPASTLRNIRAVLTDIDDTLTLHGRLPAQAFEAIHQLSAAGIAVIPVTGRPAGWCDHIARMWPVTAVVGENGAFYFHYDATEKRMHRVYAQPSEQRRASQTKLHDISSAILKKYPGTAIASDQAYREIDVAIDFCEDVPSLSFDTAQAIAREFELQGAVAKVSSIHVNAWFGVHDKLSMSLRLLEDLYGINGEAAKLSVAYCGDSPNDSPMFGYFPISVAVANAAPLLHLMPSLPNFMTSEEGGTGFAQIAKRILSPST
jgi:HAD superfamily hydrolase (TIGR01484 family)